MSSVDDFYAEIEAEAKAEGPAAVRDLRAKELKYTLISSLIAGRHDLHLTQAQLAARAGVAQEEISRIERGRKSPTVDTYARIAAALGLQPQLRRRGSRAQAPAIHRPAAPRGVASTPGPMHRAPARATAHRTASPSRVPSKSKKTALTKV